MNTIIKVMFYLALPWMFIVSYVDSFIKRMSGRYYTEHDYEQMAFVYTWVMPLGAALSTYLIILLLKPFLIWLFFFLVWLT